MFSTTTANVFAWGKANLQGDEVEKKISNLLYDETVQVISSLELNRIASFTYHESSIASGVDLSEKIIGIIEGVLSKPVDYTSLTVHKTLAVLRHVLVFGSDKVLSSTLFLSKYAEPLQNYNTAIIAQQQSFLMRMKGGGVDTGGPVRELATSVYALLTSPDQLHFERMTNADPTSLVPVGDAKNPAFITDDVRHYLLKKKMEQQMAIELRSNLAKADGGFGGGYNSKDGKAVVGAAHGLDEMMKLAQRKEQKEKSRFSDDPAERAAAENAGGGGAMGAGFADYTAPEYQPRPSVDPYYRHSMQNYDHQAATQSDLLSLDYTGGQNQGTAATGGAIGQGEADLLDFGSAMGGGNSMLGIQQQQQASSDIFGLAMSTAAPTTSGGVGSSNTVDRKGADATSDLLGGLNLGSDGPDAGATSSVAAEKQQQEQQQSVASAATIAKTSAMIMNANPDRFAALDALADPKLTGTVAAPATTAAAVAAESRIMGLTGSGGSGLPGGIGTAMGPNSRSSNAVSLYGSTVTPAVGTAAPMNSLSSIDSFSMTQQKKQQQQQQQPHQVGNVSQETYQLASIKVSAQQPPWAGGGIAGTSAGSGEGDDDSDDGGFGTAMGGAVGAGLQPLGPAPAVPPPPPPPPGSAGGGAGGYDYSVPYSSMGMGYGTGR